MEYPSLDKPKAGATRFNTDSSRLEIYDGNQWTYVLSNSPDQQTGGTRGLFFGGYGPSPSPSTRRSQIDYINVNSFGNGTDFGDLVAANKDAGACASRTRAIVAGGDAGPRTDMIQYVTISTTGDAIDFGDLTDDPHYHAACSNGHGGL